MADAKVEIEGLPKLLNYLRTEVPEKLAKQVLRDGLEAGAEVVASAAEAMCPVGSGALKADIVVKLCLNLQNVKGSEALIGPGYDRSALTIKGTRVRKGHTVGVVDTTESPGVYGYFVEEGHKGPGRGVSKDPEYRAKRRAHEAIVKEFGNGDTPPHPWMRPAWEMSKAEAFEVMIATIRAGLQELGFDK